MIHSIIIVSISIILLVISFIKSKEKSIKSIKTAKHMFLKLSKDVLAVLALVGLLLALIPDNVIASLLGNSNRFISTISASVLGAVTIIPGVIAFPLAKALEENGAHLSALAAFITTLTMVGIATFPIEVKHFGRRFALIRNSLSFILAVSIALIMGIIL